MSRLTIHVNCGSNGNDEACNARINAHVVETIDGDWHRSGTRSGTESCGQDLRHLQHVLVWQFSNDEEKDHGDGSEAVDEQTDEHGQEVFSELSNDLRQRFHLENFGGD